MGLNVIGTLSLLPPDVNEPGALTGTLRRGSVLDARPQENQPMTANKKFDLEKSLADLEALVEELESGDLPLEKAMKKFEEGIKLTRGCQAALKNAEQKVEILLQTAGGEESLEPFESEAE